MFFPLLSTVLLQVVAVILFYLAERKSFFGKLGYWPRQIIIGLVFGALAVLSTEFGVNTGSATINVRDAAPLCAGLLFGGPAGILAGLIGGIERWFAALWGAGEFTRLACTTATVLAGFIGAALRKLMFDDRKLTWPYALAIGMVVEVLHMLMVFLTNMRDIASAFSIVERCALPMIIFNGLSLMLATLILSLLSQERKRIAREKEQIAQTFQRWLLICVGAVFVLTTLFTFSTQDRLSNSDADRLLKLNLDDVLQDISDASDETLLSLTKTISGVITAQGGADSEDLVWIAETFGVSEINIIDRSGIISASTQPEFIGYDMASGTQSAQFLPLLDGERKIVKPIEATSFDASILRKYAGVPLRTGGFIQVGYDMARLQQDIDSLVVGAGYNRHVGEQGCVIICSEAGEIVSGLEDEAGADLSVTGLTTDMLTGAEKARFIADVRGEPSYCMYAGTEGYYIITTIPQSEVLFSRNISVYVFVFMEVLILAFLFVLIYFLIKRLVVNNIRKINGTLAKITGGNLDVAVDVRSNAEFASLSDDINSTVRTLKRYITEAEARIDKELEFAKSIQHSALPSVFPPYPNRTDFDIYASMHTAKEVGGDFYDFYLLGRDSLVILIADVSGKGIPAAMFMMTAKTMLKSLAETGMEVNDVFTQANHKLCETNDANMFVTAWMGILDLKTGLIRFANAGHNAPLVRHRDGSYEYLKSRRNLVLAGMDGVQYRKNELQLAPGDQIYLYTDGVTEATDMDNQLYGEDRLLQLLNASGNPSPEELCHTVKEDVDRFAGEAPQFDDITMLSVKLRSTTDDDVFTTLPDEASIPAAAAFLERWLSNVKVSPKTAGRLGIALDEIYSNIVRYSGASFARISCTKAGSRITFTFRDDGVPYNPLAAEDPDTTLSAEERKIGGLGIFMVKKLMDSMEYTREENQNVLTLVLTDNA